MSEVTSIRDLGLGPGDAAWNGDPAEGAIRSKTRAVAADAVGGAEGGGRHVARATLRSVAVALAVNCIEALGLGIVAWVSDSVSLRAQTATTAADVAVGVFLLIGLLSGARPPDETHPLGYGREGFFWSLFAALGIFVGGSGFALDGAVRSAVHPSAVGHYTTAYLVLAATIVLDAFAFAVALRPLRKRQAASGISLRAQLERSTDSAAKTVVVAGGCAVIGGVAVAIGLVASQLTSSPTPDTAAGAFIGVLLFAASVILLRTNRELLSGRGVPETMLREMRAVIAAEPGVLEIPDLFAVVVGPSSLVVDGDVTFADELDVPAVEQAIMRSARVLRERWPAIHYVYLTPVAEARLSRRAPWFYGRNDVALDGSGEPAVRRGIRGETQ